MMIFPVSIQLITLASREGSGSQLKLLRTFVSIQLITLASREGADMVENAVFIAEFPFN